MSSYTLPSGTFVYSQTLTASTADDVQFADRAGYVTVTNTGSTVLYARADGETATVAGDGCLAVMPGASELLANGTMYWNQSSNVIPAGSNSNALGPVTTSNPSTPTAPGDVTEQRSLRGNEPAGSFPSPGTVISLISTAADSYTIAFAG